MYYIASVSCGNDSVAMLYELIRREYPLDEVIYYSNGMDFDCIDNLFERIKDMCRSVGIKCTKLSPEHDLLYSMFDEPHKSRKDGIVRYGYGWCGGVCRYGTHEKLITLDKYCESKNATVYVGIASDEQHRKPDKPYKTHPLKEWGLAESDCLAINRKNGISWSEWSPRINGYINLYDILDRVSCWCCRNKNQKELYNIWYYLPQYWEKLKELEKKIGQPMKNYHTKQNGFYGDLESMERVFEKRYKSEI